MTSVLPSHPTSQLIQVQERFNGGRSNKLRLLGQPNIELPLERSSFSNGRKFTSLQQRSLYNNVIILRAASSGSSGEGSSDNEDEEDQDKKSDKEEVRWSYFLTLALLNL